MFFFLNTQFVNFSNIQAATLSIPYWYIASTINTSISFRLYCFFVQRWYTDGQLKLTAASLRDFRLAGGTQPLYPLWQGLLLFKRLLTFPIGYGNDAAFLFYTGGSHGSLFLTDDSYHYISRYTSFLLQCRYQYRIPLSLSHKDSLVPVHHKHMDILYAGCSLLHWYLHWWKIYCLFYTVLGAPSSPKKYGLSYRLFYRQEWHLSLTGLLLMYNFLPGVQQVSLLLQRYTGEYLKTGKMELFVCHNILILQLVSLMRSEGWMPDFSGMLNSLGWGYR